MIEISRRPSLVEDPNAVGTPYRRRDDEDRRASRHQTSLGDSTLTGEFGRDLGGERGEAFARRLHTALGQPDQQDKDAPPALAEALRLLAVAGLTPLAIATPDAASPPSEAPRLSAILDRIEKAVSAQNLAALPGSVSLKLDFSDLDSGLSGLSITLSHDSIDLVLTPNSAQPNIAWASAAQDLANRLHQRFPRRIVRVLEAEATPERPQGLAAFTRLLDPAGDPS